MQDSVNSVTPWTVGTRDAGTSICSDFIGRPIQPSKFGSYQDYTSQHLSISGFVYATYKFQPNGGGFQGANWGYADEWESYPIGPSGGGSFTLLPMPSGLAARLLARTNPSRPVVTPLELLQDLYELPRMLWEAGKFLSNPKAYTGPRELASKFLAVKFGWFPLIRDIHDLLDVQEHILRRRKELRQLYDGRGLRKRLKIDEDNSAGSGIYHHALISPSYVDFKWSTMTKKKSWATVRWKPTSPPEYHPDDMRANKFIRNLVLGATREGTIKGAWAIIPWTWLIDWFVNIGDSLNTTSYTVPATASNLCFMSGVQYVADGLRAEPINCAIHDITCGGAVVTTNKTRTAITGLPLPGLNMPSLDMSQLSVLSALFVQRFMR